MCEGRYETDYPDDPDVREVCGAALSVLIKWRRALADLCSRKKNGRCQPTLLAREYRQKDPASTAVFDVGKMWFGILGNQRIQPERVQR
eukprot:2236346-Pyramimonas_sp.AAC.1